MEKLKRKAALCLAALLLFTIVPAAAAEDGEPGIRAESGHYSEDAPPVYAPETSGPGSGIFQEGSFDGPQTVPGEPRLLEEAWEQQAYDLILQTYRARGSEIDLLPLGLLWNEENRSRVWEICFAVINDHPELFYVRNGSMYGGGYTAAQGWKIGHIDVNYEDADSFGSYRDLDEVIAAYDSAVSAAMAQVEDGMSDLEKALALHDYLVLHCGYDRATSLALREIDHLSDDPEAWSAAWGEAFQNLPDKGVGNAFNALVKQNAICNGYALAYKALMNEVHIDCVVASSWSHAWNLVKLDGSWYHLDATWDDSYIEGRCSHEYFLLSDERMRQNDAETHIDWSPALSCDSDAYDTGWIFSGNTGHGMHFWNGSWYYTENSPEGRNWKLRFCSSSDLRASQAVCPDVCGSFYQGLVWLDGSAYFVPYFRDEYGQGRLVRVGLPTGQTAFVGSFPFRKAASADGLYTQDADCVGLRCREGKIEAVSASTREVAGAFSVPEIPSEWRAEDGAPAIYGLTPDGSAAGISPGSEPGSAALWAAYYRNGRMVAVRVSTAELGRRSWETVPDLSLIPLDTEGLPQYDEVRLFLLGEDGFEPLCTHKEAA